MKRRGVSLLLLWTLLALPGLVRSVQLTAEQRGTFWLQRPDEEVIELLMAQMSAEETVSQVFLVGWATEEPSRELLAWIRRRSIGGVKVFGWNSNDLRVLARSISQLQREAAAGDHAIPLFTATDQEGGWVRHVRGRTSMTPGNMALGATGVPQDAYQTGYYIGAELRALGINMNFAPTVDVFVNPFDYVIGPRAFSADPVQTAVLGSAFFRGMEHHRVIATAKHFPGHGNAAEDSHGSLPEINDPFEEVWNRDLVPYRMLIREGLPAVLSGHLSFPLVTGNGTPASLSAYFKRDLLRSQLGFDGIVITDDLYMGAVYQYGRATGRSFAELCLLALEAGSDMIMLSRTPALNDVIWRTVYDAYLHRPEVRRSIDASVRRILRTKLRYLKPEDRVPLYPDPATVAEHVPHPDAERFFADHAYRSVTITSGSRIPLQPRADERILLAGKFGDFLREGSARFPSAAHHRFSTASVYHASMQERAEFRRVAAAFDTVIFCLSDPATVTLADELRGLDVELILFSILSPSYLRSFDWVQTALAVYGWGRDSYRAGFAVLSGELHAKGVLPIALPGDRP
ncbi:MAG: glycoside hydrolase family 3 protein [Spirochaetaceae bacterium]|nr:MAG: glycoside hydrolase family 3 protein [Spirochaetaceae bacterium]